MVVAVFLRAFGIVEKNLVDHLKKIGSVVFVTNRTGMLGVEMRFFPILFFF